MIALPSVQLNALALKLVIGLGCLLLWSSLSDMQRLGYQRAVIPWTDALAFYDKCSGAKSAHRFVAFAKRRT